MTLVPVPKVEEAHTNVIDLPEIKSTDQTGIFLLRSKSINNYLILLHYYGAKAMLVEPAPNRKTTRLQKSFLILNNKIYHKGCNPNIARSNNKI